MTETKNMARRKMNKRQLSQIESEDEQDVDESSISKLKISSVISDKPTELLSYALPKKPKTKAEIQYEIVMRY